MDSALRRKIKTTGGPQMNIRVSLLPRNSRSACHRSTREYDSRLDGLVSASALMIDVIPELVDIPVPTGFAGDKKSTKNVPPLIHQMTSVPLGE